jgi:hypothetical protein
LILLIASRSNSSCSSCLVRTFNDLVKTFIDLLAQQLSVQPNLISGVEDDEDEYASKEDSISSGDVNDKDKLPQQLSQSSTIIDRDKDTN